ncbi:SWIM zinc finger family protein [Actinokineospora sp. 24-640]
MSEDEWWREAPNRTIKVENGLRARSTRGEIARTWWSRRFIEVLEELGMGGRLARGRQYARAGQVVSLSLSTSIVVATVQGSRSAPYRVRIGVKAFTADQWRSVEQALAGQALYMAKLLAGEMPTGIEEVFEGIGLRLFPNSLTELSMDCSCPDWEVPCKHLAATCYLLAESFDADPFEILSWRGRARQELLDGLRARRGHATVAAEPGPDPLPEAPEDFWAAGPVVPAPPPAAGNPGAVLDRLDPLPVIVRGRPLVEYLRPAYRAFAEDA